MFCDQTRTTALRSRRLRAKRNTPSTAPKQSTVGHSHTPPGCIKLVKVGSPTASCSIYPNPPLSLEHQASSFFFSSYVSNNWGIFRSYFNHIPTLYDRLPSNSAFSSIIVALGMVGLSNFRHAPGLAKSYRTKYALALRSVNAALQDPEEAKKDQTLIAIMLLGAYEVSARVL